MYQIAHECSKAGRSDEEFKIFLREKGFLVDHGSREDNEPQATLSDDDAIVKRAQTAWDLNSDNYQTELLHIIDAKVRAVSPLLTVYKRNRFICIAYDGDLDWANETERNLVSSRGYSPYQAFQQVTVSVNELLQNSVRTSGSSLCNEKGVYKKVANQLEFTPWQSAAAVVDEIALQLIDKSLLAFATAMNQLCASLGCKLYQKHLIIDDNEAENFSAALLGSGNGGRVYKVIATGADGKETLRAMKIIGMNPSDSLVNKTKQEFDDIRRIKTICPDYVLGVCGEAITEGEVTLSNDILCMIKTVGNKETDYQARYLGYLMPTVAEPIKGALTVRETFLILRSLYSLHRKGEYHGSARMDNVVYNTERGLYQWIDFRYDDACLLNAVSWDMCCFFRSLVRNHQSYFSLPHEFEQNGFDNYGQQVVLKKYDEAWLVLEDKMNKIQFIKE